MGYRKHYYRGPRQKRRYSRPREYDPGLAESFGSYLGELIMGFMGWVGRRIWRILRPPSKRPVPPTVSRATVERSPLSLREVPLDGRRLAPNYRGLPFRKVLGVMTDGERGVWDSLDLAVKGRYRLFCKVRLYDVVCCPGDGWHERHWFRKIGRYHVDFVICDPKTTAPLLVVELDDRRHREHVRKRHDDFKDAVLRAAGLPIYRIAAQAAYDVEELTRQIEKRIEAMCP
jgi:hypothetical protein